MSSIYTAIFNSRSIPEIELAIAQCDDLNAEINGSTLLCMAIESSLSVHHIKMLLDRGAEVNFTNPHVETPLGVTHRFTETPLCVAARRSSSPDLVKLLIDHGANIHDADRFGWTPLCHAITRADPSDAVLDIVRMLLERGAVVNRACALMRTPLCLAIEYSMSLDVVKLLLDHGADVNGAGKPLCFAIEKSSSLDMVRLLLTYGADVNCVNRQGCTPFVIAFESAKSLATPFNKPLHAAFDIAKLLMEHGADS